MNRRKWVIAGVALIVSTALHAAVVGRMGPAAPLAPELDAGGEQAIPQLGDSFADMVAGGPVAPVAALPSPTVAPPELAPSVPTSEPVPPLAAPDSAPSPTPQEATPQEMAEVTPAIVPQITPPIPEAASKPPPKRPEAKADKKRAPAEKVATPKTSGNADKSSTQGSAQGVEGGASRKAASAAIKPKGDGGSAAASYGSDVLRKINSVRKARSKAKGRAVVGFEIAADGGLRSVRIVKTSGNSALDTLALDHIRRAAPFPKPPAQAKRKFSFEFVGKG